MHVLALCPGTVNIAVHKRGQLAFLLARVVIIAAFFFFVCSVAFHLAPWLWHISVGCSRCRKIRHSPPRSVCAILVVAASLSGRIRAVRKGTFRSVQVSRNLTPSKTGCCCCLFRHLLKLLLGDEYCDRRTSFRCRLMALVGGLLIQPTA